MSVKKIEVVSHRGANAVAPENTFAAAQACIELGVDYVEVDVWTSRDGILYIMHDATVDRTTDGSGHLLALTSTQIDRLDAGSWFAPQFRDERVPRLEEFLHWIQGKAKVFFDVKFAHPQQLADLIYATDLAHDCFLWSGSEAWMLLFHELAPELPLKVNVETAAEVQRAHERFGAQIVEVGPDALDSALLQACRDLNIKLMVHPKENSAEIFRHILQWEIDMINLDDPALFRETLIAR